MSFPASGCETIATPHLLPSFWRNKICLLITENDWVSPQPPQITLTKAICYRGFFFFFFLQDIPPQPFPKPHLVALGKARGLKLVQELVGSEQAGWDGEASCLALTSIATLEVF